MAQKNKGNVAETAHSAGTWSVRLKSGHLEHVADAFMRRNADCSYTFARDGRIVFDAPPGEVSCVARCQPEPHKLPVPLAVTLPASVKLTSASQAGDLALAINAALGMAGIQARAVVVLPGDDPAGSGSSAGKGAAT